MVQQSRQKDQHGVEGETDLPARDHLVDAVVQQPHHVQQGHQGCPQARDHRPVVDEVQELQVLGVAAAVAGQDGFRAVRDYQHPQIVHLRGYAERVDESLYRGFMFRHIDITNQF